MKTYLIILVLIVCIVIGYKIKIYFSIRHNFYKSLIEFAKDYRTCVLSTHEKLILIIEEEKQKTSNKIFQNFLDDFEMFIYQKVDKTEFENLQFKNLFFLSKSEISEICNFFCGFGKFDLEEENLRVKDKIISWEEKSNNLFFQERNYGNMALKLFFVFGLFLVVVFI